MQIKWKCFYFFSSFFSPSNVFIFEQYKSGIFYCSSRELLTKRMISKSPFMPHEQIRERSKKREQNLNRMKDWERKLKRESCWENCTFFPSWCTTLAWFQVLNCYFNMTTSHVVHHLHHTPSTHPDRLSVDPSCGAVMGHLRNMCRLVASAKKLKKEEKKNR